MPSVHSQIHADGGRAWIEAVAADPPLLVNGEPKDMTSLADGDMIMVGPFAFTWRTAEAVVEPIANEATGLSVADLVDPCGMKRVGSTQRWQNGRLLQHGEILLDPPAALWEEVFEEAAPAAAPARINRLELDQRLRQSLVQSWSHCPWKTQPLRADEVQELEVELASGSAL